MAHEPPLAALLPDRDVILAVTRDMHATYESQGAGPAMAKFIPFVMYDGPVTEAYLDQPPADPAMFGMSSEDDGTRTDPLMRNITGCVGYQPDLAALAAFGDGGGWPSVLSPASRWPRAAAARSPRHSGAQATVFPSNHGGFLGGEHGQTGDPVGFAAALRAALG